MTYNDSNEVFMKTFKQLSLSLLILNLLAATVFAKEEVKPKTEPVSFIHNITNKMLDQLNHRRDEIKKNASIILEIVDEVIMPHIANRTISRKVMGKQWKKASNEQKVEFTKEFTLYLKRYYSRAFLAYDNQQLKFLPKVKYKGKKTAIVSTLLLQSGKPDVSIKYRLYLNKNGDWKVIDIVIEGISLVISNQRQYASKIVSEGLESVTKKLAYKNQMEFK